MYVERLGDNWKNKHSRTQSEGNEKWDVCASRVCKKEKKYEKKINIARSWHKLWIGKKFMHFPLLRLHAKRFTNHVCVYCATRKTFFFFFVYFESNFFSLVSVISLLTRHKFKYYFFCPSIDFNFSRHFSCMSSCLFLPPQQRLQSKSIE